MSAAFPITIFHNPKCGTSRTVVETVEAAGYAPEIIEYLKAGWTRPQLESLLARMGANPRDILRTRGTPAESLGLLDPAVSDDLILDAMIAEPLLVERPIVATPKGVRLCRPAERVRELL